MFKDNIKKLPILMFVFSITFLFQISVVYANDPYGSSQSHHGVGAGYSGKGIIVAVIDSGVWQGHEDLKGSTWFNTKEIPQNDIDDDGNGYVDDYYGWNFIDNNSDMNPKGNHGTAVAGIIAAQHNDIGIAGYAPRSKIMSLTVCDDGCPDQGIFDAIKYAVDNGADIINLSLGPANGYLGYSSSYDYYIKYAYDKGVLVVATAGNGDVNSLGQTGTNLELTKRSPVSNDVGGINMVVGVGATESGLGKTPWSNYGPKYVDVYAPGKNIISTSVPIFTDGDNYDYFSGTSFSAPMISASAALLMEKYPNLKLYEIIDVLKLNGKPAFYINDLLNETVGKRSCRINTLREEMNNGDSIILSANNLMPSVSASLKSFNPDMTYPLKNAFSIIDANKFKIDTSKINIPGGEYTIELENCKEQYNSLIIKGPSLNQEVSTPTVTTPFEDQEYIEVETDETLVAVSAVDEEGLAIDNKNINQDLIRSVFASSEETSFGVSDMQGYLKNITSFSNTFIEYGASNLIKLPLDWAVSKIKYVESIQSINVMDDDNGMPYYEINISQPAKFLGIFKTSLDRSVIIDATNPNANPVGESRWYDFLFKII